MLFNQTYKLTDPFVAAWLDALREHPDAVLWLAVPHPLARRNLRARAEAAGVAGDRILFAPVVPQAEHIARLACADLALDGAAVWIAYDGQRCAVGRRAAAHLPWRDVRRPCRREPMPCRGAAGAVAESLPEYARALQALCADRARLADYRRHLEAGRTTLPLFDTAAFTRAFERMLEQAANGVAGR